MWNKQKYLKDDFTNLSHKDIQEKIIPLYEKALKYKKAKKPFVTSRNVQHLLYVKPNARSKEEMRRLNKEFLQKYPV